MITSVREQLYTAHTVVYERSGCVADAKILMSGRKERHVEAAMEALLEGLREEVGREIEEGNVGS